MRQELIRVQVAVFVCTSTMAGQYPRVRDSAGVRIVENSAMANAPIAFKPEDEEDAKNPNPYGVAHDDLDVPRCPFCAQELDPPDTKVCLNCGYNLLDRKRAESRTVYELTTGDYFMHWLPALLCILAIMIILSCSGFTTAMMRTWMVGSFLDREEKCGWVVQPVAEFLPRVR